MLMSQWQPNPPPQDLRDYIFGAPQMRPDVIDHDWDLTNLPDRVDLRNHAGSIEDQRGTNSCVGKVTISACEIMLNQANRATDLSGLFAYYNARLRHGTPTGDSGTSIRTALAQATKYGVCTLAHHPYDASRVNTKPSDQAYNDGRIRLITRYETLGALGKDGFGNNVIDETRIISDARVALSAGYPVLFSMGLTKGFLNLKGSMAMHEHTREKVTPSHPEWLGYHAMLVIGYDGHGRRFIIENSWGTGWGDQGYTAIPYDIFGRQVAGNECFVIRGFANIDRTIPEGDYISRSMQTPLHDQEIREYVMPIVDKYGQAYSEKVKQINAYCRLNRVSRPRLSQAVQVPLATVNKYLDYLW